jgi:hypothetical protein
MFIRSLAGEIQHPVEFAFNIILPLMAGPVIMACVSGVHSMLLLLMVINSVSWSSSCACLWACFCLVYTYWIWMSFRIMRGADAHSNYYLPFHPLRLISPIYGGPLYHGYVQFSARHSQQFCQVFHCVFPQDPSRESHERYQFRWVFVLGCGVWHGFAPGETVTAVPIEPLGFQRSPNPSHEQSSRRQRNTGPRR